MVPPVHSPWTLIAVAGPCSPPRIEKALQAAADLGERRARDFERMVRFCKSRIACQQSHEWFDAAVLTEARRQLGLNIDDATCDANRKRLVPILAIKAMPKKDNMTSRRRGPCGRRTGRARTAQGVCTRRGGRRCRLRMLRRRRASVRRAGGVPRRLGAATQ